MSTSANPHRSVIAAAITKVAPDVEIELLDPDADLREEAGLDSLDFLNVVTAVHDATGIEFPERDYPQLATLSSFTAYVESRSPS